MFKKIVMLICCVSVFNCVGCGTMFEKENKIYKPLDIPTIEDLKSERYFWDNVKPDWREDKIGLQYIDFVKEEEYKGGRYKVPVSNFVASRKDDDITFKVSFDVGNRKKDRVDYYWHRIGTTDILMPQNGKVYNTLLRENINVRPEIYIKHRGHSDSYFVGRNFGGMLFEKTVSQKINDEFHVEYYPKYDFALGFFRGILYSMSIGDNSDLEIRYLHYFPNNGGEEIRYITMEADDNILKANLGDPVIRDQHRFFMFRNQKGPDCVETTQINGRKYLSVWAVPGSKYFKGYYNVVDKLAKSSNKRLVNKSVSEKQKITLKKPLGLDFSRKINEQPVKFEYEGAYEPRGAKNITKIYRCIEFDKLDIDDALPVKTPVLWSEFQEAETLNKAIISYEGGYNDVDDYLTKRYGKPVNITKDQYLMEKVWSSGDFKILHSYMHTYMEGYKPKKIGGNVIITKGKI